MTMPTAIVDRLKECAKDACRRAYAPYSRFPVGAAVLANDGVIYAGANVENASYGLAMCAERNAIFQAIAGGALQIQAVVVYTPTPIPSAPCGACRQVINEFGCDALIVCCTDDPQVERHYRLCELLPDAFGPGNLDGNRGPPK